MKKSKKNYAIVVLIVLLLALAIGYAAFSATLTINGTANGTANWDVHFSSAKLKDSTGAEDTKHGTVSFTADTVTASVTLAYPGDAVLLEAVVENSGNVPAKVKNFKVVGGDDDLEITQATTSIGEKLAANGGTCTNQFVVKWAESSEADTLSKTFTVTFEYEQDTTEVNITPAHTDA